MGRRPRGEYKAFVVRDLTPSEQSGEPGRYGATKMYWAGPYSFDKWYEFQNCGHKFEFSHYANEAVLLFVVKYPEWIGKLRVDYEFVPESDFEKKTRLKEARERRKMSKKKVEKKFFFVIECVTHSYTRWDTKEMKDAPAKLYLFSGEGFPMSPDIIWLQSITRPDSGTWFTTSPEKAMQFEIEKEAEADEKLTMLVLELGYLPGDLTLTKIEPKEEDEQ